MNAEHTERFGMGCDYPLRDGAVTVVGGVTGHNEPTTQDSPEHVRLSGVIHDLNAELTILKGQVDLLHRTAERAGVVTAVQLHQRLLPLEVATRKLIRLTGELRDTYHLQTGGKLYLERRRCDLIALARRIVDERQQVSERHGVFLETANEALIGGWDAALVGRVLDNLIGNAINYSPYGGAILVHLQREGDRDEGWALLTVRDTGTGIAPVDLSHIFEPGYRGANAGSNQNGSGMGLAIVQQIVVAHGGTVTVESRLGCGSTFTVRLPLAASP